MIYNQWYAILEANEVKQNKPVGVIRLGEKLVLWRDNAGQVVCMRDLCPHRGVALSAGRLIHGNIQCPFHGFEFNSTGACVLIPANGVSAVVPKAIQVKTYPTFEAHNFIWIWWGDHRDEYPPVLFFEDIDDSFSYATLRDHWPTHYSRAIENQLDVVHLPFVHHNTIGRSKQTIVDGPIYEWACKVDDCNVLNIWYTNRKEDGTLARSAKEVTKPNAKPLLQFIFPNIWQNRLGEDLRIFIAFAPIDEENTMLYIRQYQRIVRAPILRQFFNLTSKVGNLVIERQDKRVVITQRPKLSALNIGEKLIPGDRPIIEYRRRREELQKK